jgi:hypothetical protein
MINLNFLKYSHFTRKRISVNYNYIIFREMKLLEQRRSYNNFNICYKHKLILFLLYISENKKTCTYQFTSKMKF